MLFINSYQPMGIRDNNFFKQDVRDAELIHKDVQKAEIERRILGLKSAFEEIQNSNRFLKVAEEQGVESGYIFTVRERMKQKIRDVLDLMEVLESPQYQLSYMDVLEQIDRNILKGNLTGILQKKSFNVANMTQSQKQQQAPVNILQDRDVMNFNDPLSSFQQRMRSIFGINDQN